MAPAKEPPSVAVVALLIGLGVGFGFGFLVGWATVAERLGAM